MAQELTRGIFITFDGPEGSGKSTQSRLLADELSSAGYDVLRTSEPGGTELGKRIRSILLDKRDVHLGALAELLLFEADRAQHVEEVITPAKDGKKIIICDRFNTATFAYQGYGLGMDMDLIKKVDEVSTQGTRPDLTIILDLEVETGLRRATSESGADRMEERSTEFHKKVREGYLDMAKKDPGRIKVIAVQDAIEETFEIVKKEVYGLIEGYKRAG